MKELFPDVSNTGKFGLHFCTRIDDAPSIVRAIPVLAASVLFWFYNSANASSQKASWHAAH